MQQLVFEKAWDQTISSQDRQKITTSFEAIQAVKERHLAFLWEATNYKNEKLVTTLIHNPTEEPLAIQQVAIAFENDVAIFSLPLEVPSFSSMPWTFIFNEQNSTTETPDWRIEKNII